MRHFRRDLRDAVRRFRHDPAFTLLAALTLALGIGANTAMFSVIRTVLLAPLPYGDAGRVAMIWNTTAPGEMTWVSIREVMGYAEATRTFERISAYGEGFASLTGGIGEPERVRSANVKPDLFGVLQTAPRVGRAFAEADGTPGAPGVVILGHRLWQRRFAGDGEIIGREIEVNGIPRTVVGIMPDGFRLPLDFQQERPTELWVPLAVDPANLGGWGNRGLVAVGRLQPGVDPAAATSELETIGRQWVAAGYVRDRADGRFRRGAIPVRDFITGDLRMPLAILFGTVGFVLLIALANVASLLLARTAARGRDVAIRAALGAARLRLVVQMLVESVVLAVASGVLGVGLAVLLLRSLRVMHAGMLPRIEEATLDPAVLAFTAAASIAAGILFGLAPAVQLSAPSLITALHDGGRGASSGRRRQRIRSALVVVQVSLSVVLVLGAGILTRSLVALSQIELGFDTEDVLTAQLQLPATTYPEAERVTRFFRSLEERLSQAPGIRAAGAIRALPLGSRIGDWSITIEGRTFTPAGNPNGDFQWVTPGYFEVMGIRPLEGRLIEPIDTENSDMVVVINETMAGKYWPAGDALGKRFHLGTLDQPWLTIVGIVPTVRHNAVVEEPRAEMYLAQAQVARERAGTPRSMTLVLKTSGDARHGISVLRDTVRALDPDLPLSDIRTMKEVEARALAAPRLMAWLLGGFALLALTLAAVGVYGTISLLVTDRQQEIGIRLALGAERRRVLMMVLGQGATLTVVGIGIGIVAALFLTRLLSTLVYGVSPLDPATFALVPILLSAVALAASYVPARRAARLDPAQMLRR